MAKPKEDRRTAGTYARLTEASMEQVKEIARIEDRAQSEVVRRLVEMALPAYLRKARKAKQ